MPLVALQNLGCSKNQVDGDRILHEFQASGYDVTDDLASAEIIVVNTCAFIKEAQEEAIENILEAARCKESGKCTTLVVSGCFSERYREKIESEFPEVDLWVGVDDWSELLKTRFALKTTQDYKRVLAEPIASQYLKIAEGCSHGCSFCVIPSIRGTFRSRTPESIIEEALWLESRGVRELILVAQDSSFYGRDIGITLSTLLRNLLDATSIPWIRIMYLHPNYVTDDLLELIGSQPRLCSYFDIPLQHISDKILSSMNRRPLSEGLYALIEKIKHKIPDATIRSSFIIGYPGETQKDHDDLLAFAEFARFDKLGVFPYSAEEGTRAATMRPRPRSQTVQQRCEQLMDLQREISREIMEAKIGKEVDVIIDRIAEDPSFNFEARTQGDAPEVDGKVFIVNGSFEIGQIYKVTVTGANDYDLFAEL